MNNWIKNHADTALIITFVVGAALWMNNSVKDLQKEMAVMKTVLIIKGVMPEVLATNGENK